MINQGLKADLLLTDPPYNISRKNNFKTIGRSGIDFGEWDKNFNQLSWIKDISKIINENGSVLIFNDWKNLGDISKALENEGFEIKDLIRWEKTAPMPRNTNRRYVTDFEFIIWAVKKNGKWTFNKPNDSPYLRPKIICSSPGSNRIHPTEKPEKLITDLINIHSNKGDLILDLFSGSGIISQTADKLDRYYIGSEINKKYYELSINRIKKNYVKPAFNHLGNKTRMIQELIANFPKTNVNDFIEPFAGSGIVSISYQSANKYWLNDNDENLSKILEYLFNNRTDKVINDIEKIIKKYKLPITTYKKYTTEYNKLKKEYNKDKNIAKLFVLILFGFNQQIRFNSKNEFNIPAGKFCWNDYHKEKIINFINKKDTKNFEIKSMDFEKFVNLVLEQVDYNDCLFYFDPPYYLSNATYNSSWDEESEKRLLNLLEFLISKNIRWFMSNVLISKGETNNYLQKFMNKHKSNIDWIRIDDINYTNSNYRRKNRSKKDEEVLIWGKFNGIK